LATDWRVVFEVSTKVLRGLTKQVTRFMVVRGIDTKHFSFWRNNHCQIPLSKKAHL